MKQPAVLVGVGEMGGVFARQVANDVIDIQESLTGRHFDRERLVNATVDAFQADPDHTAWAAVLQRGCPGRWSTL